MNKYLPSIEEIQPITNPVSTFYECGFNIPFNELSFIQKLKVVNDLVRQSILVTSVPDPSTETETLTGNCHTAALASIDYLKELGIGKNYKYVMCRKKSYEPDDITTTHAAITLEDENGKTYYFDATPYVGYGYGEVTPIENSPYEELYEISGKKTKLLKELRTFLYEHKTGTFNKKNFDKVLNLLQKCSNFPIFYGFISKACEALTEFTSNKNTINELLSLSFEINPYSAKSPYEEKKNYKNQLILNQIDEWEQTLQEMKQNGASEKDILKLAQNIMQEKRMLDINLEVMLPYNGKNIRVSSLTPRFFLENNLNVVFIKPSAYLIGTSATIRERFLKKHKFIDEYRTDFGKETNGEGLCPVIYSHPEGKNNLREYTGPASVILLKGFSGEIGQIKKGLRKELGKHLLNKTTTWYDGEKIFWNPFVTNLVHSTDNPSEADLHYLIGFPEHQLMTRYMYPSPKLAELEYMKEQGISEKKTSKTENAPNAPEL